MVNRAMSLLGCLIVIASAGGCAAPQVERAQPAPEGAVDRIGTERSGHPHAVRVDFSPDGKRLLTASFSDIRLWDAGTGKPIREFKVDMLNFACFSPDGKAILAENSNPTGKGVVTFPQNPKVHIFDVETGKELRAFTPIGSDRLPPHPPQIIAVKELAVTAEKIPNGPVVVYDLLTGKEICRLQSESANSLRGFMETLRLSPDGKLLAGSSYQDVYYVFDTTTGKELHRFTVHEKRRGGSSSKDGCPLLFSPDGKLLASGMHEDSIYLWDLTTGKELCRIKEFNHEDHPHACFSPDGKLLCTWERQTGVRLWEVPTGKRVHHFKISRCNSAVFSPDSKWLVVNEYNVLHVIDVTSGKELLNVASIFMSPCFSPDGTGLAAVERDTGIIRLWQVPSFKPQDQLSGERRAVESLFLPKDGKSVVSWNSLGQWRSQELETGKELFRFTIPQGRFSLSADGKLLASRQQTHGVDEPVILRDPATGKEQLRAAPQPADPNGFSLSREFALSPDSRFLAVATWAHEGGNFVISLHETAKGEVIRKLEPLSLEAGNPKPWWYFQGMSFSPDGRTLAVIGSRSILNGDSSNLVYLWDVCRGKKQPLVWGKHEASAMCYSPDGRCLLLANREKPLRLLELASGQERCTLQDSATAGPPFVFSPDGKLLTSARLAQGLADSPILLWDTMTGRKLRSLPGHTDAILSLAFTSDGKRLVSGSADTTMLVWDVSAFQKAKASTLVRDRLDACWRDLASDAAKSHTAIHTLVQGQDQTVAFLQERLPPAKLPDIDQLVRQLNADKFETREEARKQLEKVGIVAEPALRKALEGKPAPELQQQVETILAKMDGPLPADVLRDLRAIEVLEKIATAKAIELLQKLGNSVPGTLLADDAQAALTRLNPKP
jgi:WD40 repeat protein